MRDVLPWILVVALGIGWFVSTRDNAASSGDPAPEARYSEEDLATLRAEVTRLRKVVEERAAAESAEGPTLEPAGPVTPPPVRPESSAPKAKPGRKVRHFEGFGPGDAPATQVRQAGVAQARAWSKALRSLDDREAYDKARTEAFAALESKNPVDVYAGLMTVRWMDHAKTDRPALRATIEPHLDSRDPDIARAALEAATVVDPHPEDLARWLAVAREAHARGQAETTTQFLLKAADGKAEGEVAGALLHLLRDGTRNKKAFIMRGMQGFKTLDPRLEARLLEIVAAAPASDYDSAYFFHFLAPRIDPKSDALVDLTLKRLGAGEGQPTNLLRSLRRGLSEAQQRRVAESLMTFAENVGNSHMRRALLMGIRTLGNAEIVPRLEALAKDESLDESSQAAAREVAGALRRR